MGSNWTMWLLYEGGDNIVQSHAARGDNSRVVTDRGRTVYIYYKYKKEFLNEI